MKKYVSLFALLTLWTLSGCTPLPGKAGIQQHELFTDNVQATGVIAKSLPEISDALSKGTITSEALVKLYLARIEAIDRNGPALHAVLTVNPDSLSTARELDRLRQAGEIKGPLHGVPILLKDNIESKDAMPTTAGSIALKDNVTGRDSPLVAGLRAQGAIILGKANLSQWANFRSEAALSGWTVLGGQVRNPHMLDRNPCGSSSGSGVAAAASLAAGTLGTETNGSIICPSNANGVVGFKPSVGVVPQQYIIPISSSQDTAGPMTKTVMGAAIIMNAVATGTPEVDYTARLQREALNGVRVGVLQFAKGSNQAIQDLFLRAQEELRTAGAILVDIHDEPATPESHNKMAYDLMKYEFKAGLNGYLASTSAQHVKPRSLKDLIAFNQAHADREFALFDQSIFLASEAMGPLDSTDYQNSAKQVQQASRESIDTLLLTYDVQVLIAPSGLLAPRVDPINGDVWPNDWPGYGSQAARAGYPHATVPMGGFKALPVGLSFIGSTFQDANILSYAYAYEQHSQHRLAPQYLRSAESLAEIGRAMNPGK